MTTQDWLNNAKANKAALISLIRNYHPVNRQPGRRRADASNNYKGDFITAPNAEAACTVIRKQIRDENQGLDPIKKFEEALKNDDVDTISKLLNEAWFGVPESTMCWQITGFREAVVLMEDPADDRADELNDENKD